MILKLQMNDCLSGNLGMTYNSTKHKARKKVLTVQVGGMEINKTAQASKEISSLWHLQCQWNQAVVSRYTG